MKLRDLAVMLALLFVFLSTTGEQCDPDMASLFFGDNADYKAIKSVVERFKDGINSASQSILEEVISRNFEAGSLGRMGIIKDYFDQELKINNIKVSDISIDGRGAEGRVDWTGTLTLRPKPDIPYVADKIPALSGDVNARLIFGFVKEDDGKWRIKANRVLQITKSAVWGEGPPAVTNFRVDSDEGNIKVNADLTKVGGNVMLAAVNDRAIVNSIYGVKNGPIDTVRLSIPDGMRPGDAYDVYVIALGVDANFLNPKASRITGITLKQVTVPVAD